MIINKVIDLVKKEKEQSSRFPVRIIMVNSLAHYNHFVQSVKLLCDKVVGLYEYCEADDIFPRLDILKNDLQNWSYSCILVLSIGEYLRLGHLRELPGKSPQFPSIFNMQQDSTSNKKVLIPLYACEQVFEKVIGKFDERRIDHVWHIDSDDCDEHISLNIFSKEFDNVIPSEQAIGGMKEWFRLWDEGVSGKSYTLVTKLHSFVEDAHGTYSTSKITSIYEYVVNALEDGNRLKRDWGTESNWKYIATFIGNHNINTIVDVINKSLNMAKFDALSVLPKWDFIDKNQQWLFWLWYQLETNNDYISYAISLVTDYNKIPQGISNAVFSMPTYEESKWLAERKIAIDLLKLQGVDDEFLTLINQIADKKKRLRLLNCNSHEERVIALKTISQLLSEGVNVDDIVSIIKQNYSTLANYLKPEYGYGMEQLDEYFSVYRDYKLKNIYSEEINVYLDRTAGVLDSIDTRFSIIKKYSANIDKIFFLWVDGMGAEWGSILMSQLISINSAIKYSIATGKAMLPTETETNSQWNVLDFPYKKIDKLDKLAHKGEPDNRDYYSCIDKQLELMNDIARQALSHLNGYDMVIITGDHGTSRQAALAFHALVGVKPPANCLPKNFGRYCEISGKLEQNEIHPSTKKIKNYLIFRTHEHYISPGNAAGFNDGEIATVGEIHGGMTPEEMLVPVIAIYKKETPIVGKVNYAIDNNCVQPNSNNETELKIRFDNKVNSLSVFSKVIQGKCGSRDGVLWTVTFKDLSFGNHIIDVYADNKLLEKSEFSIKRRGLIVNDDL